MKWFRLNHRTTPDDEARRGAEAAEVRARQNLLQLASWLGWPQEIVCRGGRWEVVGPGRQAWEARAQVWTSAAVASAGLSLWRESLRRDTKKAAKQPADVDPRTNTRDQLPGSIESRSSRR